MITVDQWSIDLLVELGAPDGFEISRHFLAAWALGENTKARFNPLATTWSMPGDSPFNTFGDHGQYHVRNYASYADGLHATVATLHDGYYPTILGELLSGQISIPDAGKVHSELNTWGTGGDNVFANLSRGVDPRWVPPSLATVVAPLHPITTTPLPPAPIQGDAEMGIVVTEHGTGYLVSGGSFIELDAASLANALGADTPPIPHFTIDSSRVPQSRIVKA